MTDDRRSHNRISIRLPVKWDAMSGSHEARTEDISLSGCFIDTAARVELQEVVDLEVQLPSGDWLPISGTVASYQPSIGFGLLFSSLTKEAEDALTNLLR
jgi:PilZ domain-containing protein